MNFNEAVRRRISPSIAGFGSESMASPQKTFRIERAPVAAAPGQQVAAPVPTPAIPVALGNRTRAAIRAALVAGTGLRRATVELQAVISDAARAANAILAAVEEIDGATDRLRVARGGGGGGEALDDISERCLMIMQACDFQDLTGQRIANVIGLFADLESRLSEVRAVLDEDDGIDGLTVTPRRAHATDLENGPRLQSDTGHMTQGQIDIMFDELGEGF